IKSLTDFSNHLSYCISKAKYEEQNKLLALLYQTLIETPVTDSLNNTLNSVLKHLVSPKTSFEACILRIIDRDLLKVAAAAGDERISLASRNNGPRIVGEGFAGKTFTEEKAKFFLIGEQELKRFKNEVWIRENELKSFGCFPLIVEGRIVGTLSIFAGYEYTFHESAITFIEAVTSILASFVYKEKLEIWKRAIQKFDFMAVFKSEPGLIKLKELLNAQHLVDSVVGFTESDSEAHITRNIVEPAQRTNNIESYKEYREITEWVNDNRGKFVAFVDGKWIRSSKDGSKESRREIIDWLAKSFPDQQRFVTKVESDIDSEVIEIPMSSYFDGFQD
ncbi:MAG: GAF domain-containing protein, partial [Cyanobacteria bacterium P01_B01_bin.77]